MAGLCMIVNVIHVIESENKQIPHVSRQKTKQKKPNMYNVLSTIIEETEYM